MTGSSRIPSNVDARSAALLERAYSLKGARDTHDLYRDWAETYDKTMLDGLGYVSPRLVTSLLAQHVSERDQPVLDVGCGTGLAGHELSALKFSTIDALDYSADMLAQAGKRGIYRNLIETDLTSPLDLASETYGAAVCSGTFTHGHVGPSCLVELFRVLKPGALFAFSVNAGVWTGMGFDEELARLEKNGTAHLLHRQAGVNYKTSTQPDSWLNLYERK